MCQEAEESIVVLFLVVCNYSRGFYRSTVLILFAEDPLKVLLVRQAKVSKRPKFYRSLPVAYRCGHSCLHQVFCAKHCNIKVAKLLSNGELSYQAFHNYHKIICVITTRYVSTLIASV